MNESERLSFYTAEIDALRSNLSSATRELEQTKMQLCLVSGQAQAKEIEIQHLRELINSAAVNGTA